MYRFEDFQGPAAGVEAAANAEGQGGVAPGGVAEGKAGDQRDAQPSQPLGEHLDGAPAPAAAVLGLDTAVKIADGDADHAAQGSALEQLGQGPIQAVGSLAHVLEGQDGAAQVGHERGPRQAAQNLEIGGGERALDPATVEGRGLRRLGAQLDARLLPGESCEAFREELAEVIHDPKVELQTILSFPSRSSSPDTPLYRAIEAVAARHDPSALVVPRLIGGFTDAHWFRELGLVAYGFVPRALTPDEARRVHGVDERVDTATLARSIELMVEVVRSFDALETEEARKGSGRESGRTPSKDEGPSVRPGPSKYRKDAD